jgi:hypothetical protein
MIIDQIIDNYVWWLLQWYYMPYKIPEIMGDTDKWVQQVSTNGARWSNFCKPN